VTHTVQISGDRWNDRPALTFTCDAAEGADCRLTCPQGCDTWELPDHEHTLVDAGECLVVTWLQEGDETYGGKDGALLASVPIEVEWTGGGYLWSRA
jgi:hypothetical protein